MTARERKCPDCKLVKLGPPIGGFHVLRCPDCAGKWLEARTRPVLKEEAIE